MKSREDRVVKLIAREHLRLSTSKCNFSFKEVEDLIKKSSTLSNTTLEEGFALGRKYFWEGKRL